MIKAFEKLFDTLVSTEPDRALSQQEINLAVAALLVEVATIDSRFDDSEWQQLQQLLMEYCGLDPDEALDIAKQAKASSADATSLYEFTQAINRHSSHEEKRQLVTGLWQIAYADGNLDKYEEHIIRRIADLIHLSHSDFIQTKIAVRDEN